jgi:hypothetical protein
MVETTGLGYDARPTCGAEQIVTAKRNKQSQAEQTALRVILPDGLNCLLQRRTIAVTIGGLR